jgi:hypothetical protein
MTAAFDDGLTASDVLSRVYGHGLLHCDKMLEDVSAQDRAKIVEAYDAGDIEAIASILDGSKEKPVETKKKPAKGKSQAE